MLTYLSSNESKVVLNGEGNVLSVLNPLGERTTTLWDRNQKRATIDALGNRTSYLYHESANGSRPLRVTIDALGSRSTYVYDSQDRVAAKIDKRGYRTTLVWDGNGNRIGTINAEGNRSSYVYDSSGELTAYVDELGNRDLLRLRRIRGHHCLR